MRAFLFPCAVCLSLVSSVDAGSPSVSLVVGSWLPGESRPVDTTDSLLDSPFGVDFDRDGTMYFVELSGGRVFLKRNAGELKHIAGDGSKSYTGDGKLARHATFNGMHNIAVTPSGDIYISDSWNHCIRKIDAKSGIISTVAGTGKAGFSGDGGPARLALFDFIMCITLDKENKNIYLADLHNRRIRVMDLETQIVRTVAGNGAKGVPIDGSVAIESPLVDPRAVAVDSRHRVYILERGGHALRVVTPDGTIRTVAGTGKPGGKDGAALSAQLNSPKHLCVDHQGNVFVADDQNGLIRMYNPRRETLTTVLGRGNNSPQVKLKNPHGVGIGYGQLYVVDTGHNRILRMLLPRK